MVIWRLHVVRCEERYDEAAGLTSPPVRMTLREDFGCEFWAQQDSDSQLLLRPRARAGFSLGSAGVGVEEKGAYGVANRERRS